jgi:hypothetical protein
MAVNTLRSKSTMPSLPRSRRRPTAIPPPAYVWRSEAGWGDRLVNHHLARQAYLEKLALSKQNAGTGR